MALADARHRRAQRHLDEQLGRRLGAILASFDDLLAQESFDAYNRAATTTVAGAQRRSAQLGFAYVAAVTAARPKRSPSVARALGGVLVTRDSPVTRSPMLRIWGMVAQGVAVAEALSNAQAYAATLASNDLAVAERGGLDEAADASGQRIVGWRKELDDDACDWCQLVGAERIYSSAESVPFHANDECSVAPVFADEGEEA